MVGVQANVKGYLHRAMGKLVSVVLRPGAVFDRANFRLWEKAGYHIVPVHYYYPIPDTRELAQHYPRGGASCSVDLKPDAQLEFLERVIKPFARDFSEFTEYRTDVKDYYWNNDAFAAFDGCVYYGILQTYRPKLIVEIGSGLSTLLAVAARRRHGMGRHLVVDPYPGEHLAAIQGSVEIIPEKVERLDPGMFDQLMAGDILFIDSSHVIRTGGDVSYLYLEILPRLKPGVIVHSHDIYLPFEYPREMVLGQQFFWTEQYLLQAYLTENPKMEVLFANHFMAVEHAGKLDGLLPSAPKLGGASFWMVRR